MAEERNDGQERSQPATPRKLEQLRGEGQVPRSADLTATAVLLGMASALLLLGHRLVEALSTFMTHAFQTRPGIPPQALVHVMADALTDTVVMLAPFLAVAVLAALLAPLALGGWVLSARPLRLDFGKLDPVRGLTRRVFTVRGLMEMLKAGAKFTLVSLAAILLIRWQLPGYLALAGMDPAAGLALATRTLAGSFLALAAVMVVIAAIDVPFQKWNFARQNRMSLEEIKRELRNEEGAPELRAKIRSMQRQLAQRRMMEAVEHADVVITNPTHYAVALKYEPRDRHSAPRLVASGADLVSWQIRSRARRHGVPVVEAPALARAVYHSTKLGHEIPFGLYAAVAAVLKYAYRLRGRPGFGDAPAPRDLPIPEELRFD